MGGGAENVQKQQQARKITLEELAKHRTPNDAWLSYRGKVYDVSNWEDHPGELVCLQPWVKNILGMPEELYSFSDSYSYSNETLTELLSLTRRWFRDLHSCWR